MKKTLAFVLALCMIFALCACGSNANTPAPTQNNDAQGGADALDPITIVFATPNANVNIESEYAQKWMAAVTEKSGGKITFDYTTPALSATTKSCSKAPSTVSTI